MNQEYLNFATNLAKQAGEIIRTNFKLGQEKSYKSDNSPVTEVDIAINKLVIEAIAQQYPDHSILGEEQSTELTSEYVWVCDPIDGTIPFSSGLPLSTFSLALTHKGEVILGVVYDPYMDRLFTAVKGEGALLNGQPIKVSDAATLDKGLVNLSGWTNVPYDAYRLAKSIHDASATIFCIRSSVMAGMLVGCGEFVAQIFGGKTPWDVAAIKIIVEEAGGKVTSIDGGEQRYDGEIKGALVTNGKVHDELLEMIRKTIE